MQMQRCCIVRWDRRRGWHEADVPREMCQPAEAEPLYLEAAGIYRQLGEKATLDLANSLRGLALVNEPAAKMDASKTLWQEAVSYMRNAM